MSGWALHRTPRLPRSRVRRAAYRSPAVTPGTESKGRSQLTLRLPPAPENGAFSAFQASAFAGRFAPAPTRYLSRTARGKEFTARGRTVRRVATCQRKHPRRWECEKQRDE